MINTHITNRRLLFT